MLRVLIFAMVMSVLGAFAWAAMDESAPQAADVDRAAEQARSAVRQALEAPKAADEIKPALEAKPLGQGPLLSLPAAPRADQSAGPLLALPEPHPWDIERDPKLLVMVSFSMPQTSLRALATQARRVGAPLVLRGLVKDSFPDTLAAIHQLAGKDAGTSGFAIDPTLFTRFGVQSVPTYVLLLEPLRSCTAERCEVPRHLRLSGEAGLRHVLEAMDRGAAPEASGVVAELIARLEDPP